MKSRMLALAAAVSLAAAPTPSLAQTPAPAPQTQTPAPTAQRDGTFGREAGFFKSDLLFMLAAIAGAVLLTVLATQIGGGEEDQPASP